MSGETNSEKSRRVQDQHPGQGSLSGESDVDEKVPDEKQDLEMTDWDRYLSQVMAAYNSTQHSTTGVSPHMMLTGHKKSLPLTFFYPEYEGKKTSPQVYVRDVIRRQQELNDLCRRNTQQVQARQRKGFDKKAASAKAYSVGDYVWVFQNVIPPKGTKKLLKKWRGPFMITEVHQEGRFYRLSTGRAAHYENIKLHNPSTED